MLKLSELRSDFVNHILAMKKKETKKVLVGMSGGVDSSVTAALLKKAGFDVIGIHMRLFSTPDKKDARDAEKVCRFLGIPFFALDARKKFRELVIDYFVKEYEEGRTPNPCVICNLEIKFKLLLGEMARIKADYLATGHYARIKLKTQKHAPSKVEGSKLKGATKKSKISKKTFRLHRADDESKDQSYFLYRLTQKELSKAVFPLGDLKKTDVRKMAEKWKLPVAKKDESQDVCFIPAEGVEKFLANKIRMRPGPIMEGKNIIGTHKGLPLYTLGQRKRLGVGGRGPYYVFKKDRKKNAILVTNKFDHANFETEKAEISQVTWISEKPKFPLEAMIVTRYRKKPVCGTIEAHGKTYIITFLKPERLITPGQSAVFYSKKGEVLGGGIII